MRINQERIGSRCLLALAGVLLIAIPSYPAMAQATASLSTPMPNAATSIGCAPSNNGTGHLVCGQFVGGAFTGVSWQAPAPPGGTLPNRPGIETSGKVDHTTTVSFAGQTPSAPSCGPANDGSGSAVCMVTTRSTDGSANFFGVSFYPPTSAAPSPTLSLFSTVAGATVSQPACTSAGAAINGHGVALCVLTTNGELVAIAFEPFSGTKTAVFLLSNPANFVGNPSCSSGGFNTTSMCAIQQGSGLSGFAVGYNPTANTVGLSAPITPLGSPSQPLADSAHSLSCAVPGNDPAPPIDIATYPVTCAILGQAPQSTPFLKPLLGITFDLTTTNTGYMPLGSSSGASVSCTAPNVAGSSEVACVALNLITTTSGLYAIKFDPRTKQQSPIEGPFPVSNGIDISCITLAIDANQITCGVTTTSGRTLGTEGVNISFNP